MSAASLPLGESVVSQPSVASSKTRTHLGILDFLRGFAALAVCLFHFSSGTNLTKFYSSHLAHGFSWGYLGVEVFFVISGFVIPYSLYNTSYQLREFGRYFSKRVARICPPAYVNILLILGQWLVIDHFLHHNMARIGAITAPQVESNLLFIVPFTHSHWFNGVFWTLALEFQFYIVVGLLFNKLFTAPSLARFLVISLALSALRYFPGLPQENYFAYNSLFMMGGATLLYFKGAFHLRDYLVVLAVFAFVASMVLSPVAMLFGLVTALLIAFVKVQHPLFAFFGKISYSLYLTHFLVGSTTEFIISRFFHPTTELGNVGAISVCAVVAFCTAYGFFVLVEKPFIKLAKRFF